MRIIQSGNCKYLVVNSKVIDEHTLAYLAGPKNFIANYQRMEKF